MKKTTTKTAGFKTFEAAKLAAGKYAGMGINRSEEREHDGKSFTYYHSSAGNVSRDWYALRASDIAAIGYECLGFWDIPAGLKAAALMVCRISDYSRNFRFSLDRLGAWMFHYDNPEGIEYSNGSAEDVKGDRVEMDDDQNARDFVCALSKFERVQIWEKNGKIFMAVGSIDNGTLLLLNAGVNARFVAAEDDVWTVDPVAEIVAAVASYPAEPVAACEAPKAENCDAEGENARVGAEVRQEAETVPEAKETAKAEAVPDSVRNYEKAEAERKAKEEAEAKKEREEREAHYCDLDEKARESVATWLEAFPLATGVAPFVTVEWCEINAIHETGEEHAQEEGTPATRWSLDAFNMVTEDLDRYVKGCGWFGYFKLKYTVEFPDGDKYTDRIDLGDGVGGLVESARSIVKYNEDRKASGEEYGGTIYGGSVEEWRARLERLEAATDPDAVAMARGLLELGETA